jgi:hypothetical protein
LSWKSIAGTSLKKCSAERQSAYYKAACMAKHPFERSKHQN